MRYLDKLTENLLPYLFVINVYKIILILNFITDIHMESSVLSYFFTLFELYVPYSLRDSKFMAVSLMEVGYHQQHDKNALRRFYGVCQISNQSWGR